MKTAHLRLINQHLVRPKFKRPGEIVRWLGAVQAQDYAGAKWSLGVRLQKATDDVVEQAFANGEILRTHLLRPTWHFVAPDDVRWLLALTAPRINAANAHYYRKLELDDALFKRSNAALAKALRGGRQLTREELRSALQNSGIATDDGLRTTYLVMRAELDGIVCSGARRGKQFTYALLDERVPPNTESFDRDEALANLAHRYFLSRGPATVHDFAKWSGLTVTDARIGLDGIKSKLTHAVEEGTAYWFSKTGPALNTVEDASASVFLLSIYDEYISGYKDYRAVVDEKSSAKLRALGNLLQNIIVVGGQVVGTWNRKIESRSVSIKLNLLTALTKSEHQGLTAAARQYGDFFNRRVEFI